MRRFLQIAAVFSVTILGYLVVDSVLDEAARSEAPRLLNAAHATPAITPAPLSMEAQLERSPIDFLRRVRRDYHNRVRDYVCQFGRQERLGGELSKKQVSNVKFREGPFSVFMHVIENAGKARRVLFVKDQLVRDGGEFAIIQPEGPIARLFVRSVERRIDGPEARKASRKAITEFGLSKSLDMIIRYAEESEQLGRLDLRYLGESEINGRPTFVIERRLPVDVDNHFWPDALLVVHIDQEWLVPVSCALYGDAAGRELLGNYSYSDIQFNVGLRDADFEAKTYGL